MSKTACVIDDYSINLRIAELLIKKHGFFETTTSFLKAQDAINLLENDNNNHFLPDVIFLDLNMPTMDGWQFLEKFEKIKSKLDKHIDVYILSSSVDKGEIQHAKDYPSVKGFLSKPLNMNMLQDVAKTALSNLG